MISELIIVLIHVYYGGYLHCLLFMEHLWTIVRDNRVLTFNIDSTLQK